MYSTAGMGRREREGGREGRYTSTAQPQEHTHPPTKGEGGKGREGEKKGKKNVELVIYIEYLAS